MNMRYLALGLVGSLAAHAGPLAFQSPTRQTSLLELYTSEGCSSCPSAEAWLSKLENAPGLWKEFVPVAFHVDYWNYLGWRDPWSSAVYSDRQRAYAQAWSSDNIYTPAFVLDGKEWRNWMGLRHAPSSSGAMTGILKAVSDDTNHWTISFSPANASAANYHITAALLASGLDSDVRAGENQGRHLQHAFVALDLADKPLALSNGVFQTSITLPIPSNAPPSPLALAVWVARQGDLGPVQAVGGWLTPPTAAK